MSRILQKRALWHLRWQRASAAQTGVLEVPIGRAPRVRSSTWPLKTESSDRCSPSNYSNEFSLLCSIASREKLTHSQVSKTYSAQHSSETPTYHKTLYPSPECHAWAWSTSQASRSGLSAHLLAEATGQIRSLGLRLKALMAQGLDGV